MVYRIIAYISKEISSLHQAAYLLAIFAFLSQILALIRDRLLAHNFGAGIELDMYYAAFRIPDVIFVTVASLVSISVMIPMLVQRLEIDKDKARDLINSVFSFFFLLIVLVSFAVFMLMPFLIGFFFQGFSLSEQQETIFLARLLLLTPILLGLSNLLASITQSFKQFFVYALSPVVYNVGIITGIVFLAPHWGVTGVVLGVVLGALLHGLIQVPLVIMRGLLPKFSFPINLALVKNIVTVSLPRTLTLGVHQLSMLVLISMASLMVSGSIAIFNFSFNLQSIPLSIIGVSYSLAAFPVLSQMFVRGQMKEFGQRIATAARHVIFWSIPIAVLFIVLRAQIVRTVLGSGEFGWVETRLTAATLALFAVSVVFQGLVLLFVKGYYSTGNTWKPFIINGISGLSIIVFSFALVQIFERVDLFRFFIEDLLRVQGVEGTVILMLPLGYSLGFILNGIILLYFFSRDFTPLFYSIRESFFHVFSSSVIMGFVTYLALGVLAPVFNLNTFWGIFLQGLLSGLLGILVGFILLYLFKSKELKEILDAVKKRFWRSRVLRDEVI